MSSSNFIEAARISKEVFGTKLDAKVERELSKTLIVDDLVKQFSKDYGIRQSNEVSAAGVREQTAKASGGAAITPKKGVTSVVKGRRMLKFLKDDLTLFLFGALAVIGQGIAFPLAAYFVAEFLHIFFYFDDTKTPAQIADYVKTESDKWSIVFVGMAVGIGICGGLQMSLFGAIGDRFVQRMRHNVFKTMMYQDIEFFDTPENSAGQLSTVLSADCETAKAITGANLSVVIQNTATFCFAIIVGFWTLPLLALYTLLACLPVAPAMMIQGKLLKDTRVRADPEKDLESAAFTLSEVTTQLRTVASWGIQEVLFEQYRKSLLAEREQGEKNALVTGIFSGIASTMVFLGNAASFKAGGTMMLDHPGDPKYDMQKVMRTILVISMSAQGIGRGAAWATDRSKAREAAGAIFQVLDKKPTIDPRDPSGIKDLSSTDLSFKQLKFRYPTRPEAPIFNEVTFDVKEGEIVGLVGASGCGKSTIFEFLLRYYDVAPTDSVRLYVECQRAKADEPESQMIRMESVDKLFQGNVILGNEDIRSYNVHFLRDQIGLVSQQPVLFTDTVANNIRWGKADATMEEVIRAAKQANAHDFIMELPNQYDEIVSRGGTNVSGGQKQRIAIARAFIANRRIVLLDEITSALDRTNEVIVQNALDDILKQGGRTALIIAHRLSTLSTAHKLVVFRADPGRGSHICEVGTPTELANKKDGVYAALLELSKLSETSPSQSSPQPSTHVE